MVKVPYSKLTMLADHKIDRIESLTLKRSYPRPLGRNSKGTLVLPETPGFGLSLDLPHGHDA